jgi:hypothetical protein
VVMGWSWGGNAEILVGIAMSPLDLMLHRSTPA